jgi:hypothetical protein
MRQVRDWPADSRRRLIPVSLLCLSLGLYLELGAISWISALSAREREVIEGGGGDDALLANIKGESWTVQHEDTLVAVRTLRLLTRLGLDDRGLVLAKPGARAAAQRAGWGRGRGAWRNGSRSATLFPAVPTRNLPTWQHDFHPAHHLLAPNGSAARARPPAAAGASRHAELDDPLQVITSWQVLPRTLVPLMALLRGRASHHHGADGRGEAADLAEPSAPAVDESLTAGWEDAPTLAHGATLAPALEWDAISSLAYEVRQAVRAGGDGGSQPSPPPQPHRQPPSPQLPPPPPPPPPPAATAALDALLLQLALATATAEARGARQELGRIRDPVHDRLFGWLCFGEESQAAPADTQQAGPPEVPSLAQAAGRQLTLDNEALRRSQGCAGIPWLALLLKYDTIGWVLVLVLLSCIYRALLCYEYLPTVQVVLTVCTTRLLRVSCFSATTLPVVNLDCRLTFEGIQNGGGCGDYLFSGHAIIQATFLLMLHEQQSSSLRLPVPVLLLLCSLSVVALGERKRTPRSADKRKTLDRLTDRSAPRDRCAICHTGGYALERHHYSVDVLLACYLTPACWAAVRCVLGASRAFLEIFAGRQATENIT